MSDKTHEEIAREFSDVVNMNPADLEHWLGTEESRRVGWVHEGEHESVGHQSGRRIVAIKCKNRGELPEGDYEHMLKVVGYVHRHLAQRPGGDVRDSRWRYSLMNWGHDPLKDKSKP